MRVEGGQQGESGEVEEGIDLANLALSSVHLALQSAAILAQDGGLPVPVNIRRFPRRPVPDLGVAGRELPLSGAFAGRWLREVGVVHLPLLPALSQITSGYTSVLGSCGTPEYRRP